MNTDDTDERAPH